MYNDELKKALEETFRERFDRMNAAENQEHEFSYEFENKMDKLIRSSERGEPVNEEDEDFEEVKPVKKRFTAVKWAAAAAGLCIAAAGGIALIRAINNPVTTPVTPPGKPDISAGNTVAGGLPEYIPAPFGDEQLPIKEAYYEDEDGGAYCKYNFAAAYELFAEDENGVRHDYFDNIADSPDNFEGLKYHENGSSEAVSYNTIPYTKLYAGDKFGGMTVTDAGTVYKVEKRERYDGTAEYFFSDATTFFSVSGDLTLHGYMEYNSSDGKAYLCADTDGLREKLPYIPHIMMFSEGVVPTSDDSPFWFTAVSAYPLIEIIPDNITLSLQTGIYDVNVTFSAISYNDSKEDASIKATASGIEVNEEMGIINDGEEYPESMPLDGVMLPVGAPDEDGAFRYDYALVKYLGESELWYTANNESYDYEANLPLTGTAVLTAGDKVGDMTVTEAGMLLFPDGKELSVRQGGFNRFTLSGEMVITGTLSYSPENGYELCADPRGFDTLLPYIPVGMRVIPSEAVDTYNNIVAESGYPDILIGRPQNVDMSGFAQDKTYNVAVTVSGISFDYNVSGSYSGISVTGLTDIKVSE